MFVALIIAYIPSVRAQDPKISQVMLALHAGTGTLPRAELTPAIEREYPEQLAEALRAG
jgi:hypothetical protein